MYRYYRGDIHSISIFALKRRYCPYSAQKAFHLIVSGAKS